MNTIKMIGLVSALFAAQSAMAGTYDFGLMGPPATKTISAAGGLGTFSAPDLDTFTFSISSDAIAAGGAPDVRFIITLVDVQSVKLFDSSNVQIGATDTTPGAYSFGILSAGAYTLAVTNRGITNYNVTLSTTAVPEPEAYAMMLAGLGLVGFAARRKMSA